MNSWACPSTGDSALWRVWIPGRPLARESLASSVKSPSATCQLLLDIKMFKDNKQRQKIDLFYPCLTSEQLDYQQIGGN